MLPTAPGYFTSYVGVLLAGAVPVPIYPPTRPSQLEDHLRRQVRVLDNAAAVSAGHGPRRARSAGPAAPRPGTEPRPCARCASELSTSGPEGPACRRWRATSPYCSTRRAVPAPPKGVVLTHANLHANTSAMGRAARPPGDVGVSWLPLYHDMGLIGAASPVYSG